MSAAPIVGVGLAFVHLNELSQAAPLIVISALSTVGNDHVAPLGDAGLEKCSLRLRPLTSSGSFQFRAVCDIGVHASLS